MRFGAHNPQTNHFQLHIQYSCDPLSLSNVQKVYEFPSEVSVRFVRHKSQTILSQSLCITKGKPQTNLKQISPRGPVATDIPVR